MLRECATTRRCQGPRWLTALVPGKARLKEIRYLSKLPPDVKRKLLEQVQGILRSAIRNAQTRPNLQDGSYTMLDIRTSWGHKALRLSDPRLFEGLREDERPKFGDEFEEDVLVWHIATCIFLQRIRRRMLTSKSQGS